jgi:hypothetical protein
MKIGRLFSGFHFTGCAAALTLAAAILTTPLPLWADWKAGAAGTDITPSHPVRLSGYGNRTAEHERVSLPIHAKALAITWDKEPPLVMLTVDNCGVPADMRSEVLNRVNRAGWRLEDARFSLHSSHTHCAPMLPGVLPFLFGQELTPPEHGRVQQYARELTAKMTEVVLRALNEQAPAKLDWNTGKVRFAMNRRLQRAVGLANSPNPYGPVDHQLPVLRVTAADGTLKAIYTSYACHCTTLSINEIHPDWAGTAQRELELRFPGVVALTAIGCGADQNPYPRREMRFVQEHGVELAREAVRVINEPMRPLSGPTKAAAKEIRLPFEPLPDAATLRQRADDPKSAKAVAMHARHFLGLLERGQPVPQDLPYLVQVWLFGSDLLTINLPGEVVVDYSLRFKRQFDPNRTWVNGYTNDVPCYIPSQRVWEEGGYEAAGAMTYYGRPNRFATGIEELIAKAVEDLVPKDFQSAVAQE